MQLRNARDCSAIRSAWDELSEERLREGLQTDAMFVIWKLLVDLQLDQ